jgi:cation:H+ antiporter
MFLLNVSSQLSTNLGGFAVCAAIIFFAGQRLSYFGDLIAEKTGLGKAWIGLILMATVTSLPELVVGISSSALVASADLAVGDVLGSCMFNLAILAFLDLFVPKHQHLFFLASPSRHILSATLGTVLIAMVGLGLFLPHDIVLTPGIGVISVIFVIIYLASIRIIYRFDKLLRTSESQEASQRDDLPPLKKLVLYYMAFAFLIVGAALFIPYFAEGIAVQTGIGNSFVGTVLVAASTSLPEIAVSIAAIRMGSVDLAIGNLFGSNIFNILILAIDDLFYTKGVLLKDASDTHLLSVMSCVIMSAIAIAGFTYRSPNKKYLMALDALLILLFYIANLILLYVITR